MSSTQSNLPPVSVDTIGNDFRVVEGAGRDFLFFFSSRIRAFFIEEHALHTELSFSVTVNRQEVQGLPDSCDKAA